MIGIYRILNKTNNKSYIGSSNGIEGRWRKHKSLLRRKIHWNEHLQNAWNKDGENNFEFIVLEETDKLLEREQYYLDTYQAYNNEFGYNKAMSADNATRGRHLLKEHRQKLSLALKGRKQAKEHIKHVSEALKGKPKPEAVKEKIRQTLLGRKLTNEHKKHISEGGKGRAGCWKGKKLSEEHKQKISAGMKGIKYARRTRKTYT